MNQKGIAYLYILLGTLLLVLVGGGAYYLGTKYLQPQVPVNIAPVSYQATPTPTVDQTANWKKYANSDYNYSIKYPPDFVFSKGLEYDFQIKNQDLTITFVLVGLPEKRLVTDYAINGFCLATTTKDITKTESLNNITVYKTEKTYPSSDICLDAVIPLPKTTSNGYETSYWILDVQGKANTSSAIALYNQILSTFTFTNQNQTNNVMFPIPELGIKLTINNQLKDLVYKTITEPSGTKIIGVSFSTKSLINADTEQPSGWITNSPYCGAENDPLGDIVKEDQPQRGAPIKINNFYIYYEKPQAPCSQNTDVQNLQSSQQKQLEQIVQSVQPL